MFRLDYPDVNDYSIYDLLLPKQFSKLPEELAKVDELLQNEAFESEFFEKFYQAYGRGTVPFRVFIRMMYLKHSLDISYDSVEDTINRDLVLRRFCRIPLTQKVPDSTTLVKLNQKYQAEDLIKKLNVVVVQMISKKKASDIKTVRIDTTVTESNIHYPTDVSLLADCAKTITRTVEKIKVLNKTVAKTFRSKKQIIKEKVIAIAKVLKRRTGERVDDVRKVTKEVVEILEQVQSSAASVLRKVQNSGQDSLKKLGEDLKQIMKTSRQVLQQTKQVVSGAANISNRIVSVHNKDARPIKTGKLNAPVQFGHKVQITEARNGIVTGYQVYTGNPQDSTLMEDAIKEHTETTQRPINTASMDRGYTSQKNEQKMKDEYGVKNIIIPRRGNKSKERQQIENSPTFRKYKSWRSGIEGRISILKRKYGLKRSRYNGLIGTQNWVGWGILAHNMQKAVEIM